MTTQSPETPWYENEKFSTIVQFVTLLFIVIAFRSLVFQPFSIPSASMVPTLLVGDYIGVTKFDYGYSRYSFPFGPPLFEGRVFGTLPQRGDVAVFRYTQNTSLDFIKRVIGLPGDRIRVEEGRVYVNDRQIPREKIGPYEFTDEVGKIWPGTEYFETLAPPLREKAKKYTILQVRTENEVNNTAEYTVPQGCLFMMGDDRDDSADSRFQGGDSMGKCAAPFGNDYLKAGPEDLGFVPVENLVGKARRVLFSIDFRHPVWQFWYWPVEVRWNRFFKPII